MNPEAAYKTAITALKEAIYKARIEAAAMCVGPNASPECLKEINHLLGSSGSWENVVKVGLQFAPSTGWRKPTAREEVIIPPKFMDKTWVSANKDNGRKVVVAVDTITRRFWVGIQDWSIRESYQDTQVTPLGWIKVMDAPPPSGLDPVELAQRISELEAEYDRLSDRGLDTFKISEALAGLRAEMSQQPAVAA